MRESSNLQIELDNVKAEKSNDKEKSKELHKAIQRRNEQITRTRSFSMGLNRVMWLADVVT